MYLIFLTCKIKTILTSQGLYELHRTQCKWKDFLSKKIIDNDVIWYITIFAEFSIKVPTFSNFFLGEVVLSKNWVFFFGSACLYIYRKPNFCLKNWTRQTLLSAPGLGLTNACLSIFFLSPGSARERLSLTSVQLFVCYYWFHFKKKKKKPLSTEMARKTFHLSNKILVPPPQLAQVIM